MKIVSLYNIISLREKYTRCELIGKYYLEVGEEVQHSTKRPLYLCYGDVYGKMPRYSQEITEGKYEDMINCIKEKLRLINKWVLEDMEKSIDNIAEISMESLPNNSPCLCK